MLERGEAIGLLVILAVVLIGTPRRNPPRPPGGDGGSRVREPRRPRPSSGAGTASREP
ncbi:MAG TPA: hypothetical protein VJ622_01070 [Acidimicrobiia bacterium]|nr:hypothetical protein [Acidimicrobiia bacterium]HTC80229.1 hypothetical protein [Acidimicrobiia bacterium]